MLAQRLRHRIAIQSEVEVQSPAGERIGVVWTDFVSDLPAELVPLSGREFVAANAEQSEIAVRATIRFLEGVTTKHRVVHEGVAYDIKAILPDPTFSRHLTLMLSAGVRYEVPESEDVIGGGDAESDEDEVIGGGGA